MHRNGTGRGQVAGREMGVRGRGHEPGGGQGRRAAGPPWRWTMVAAVGLALAAGPFAGAAAQAAPSAQAVSCAVPQLSGPAATPARPAASPIAGDDAATDDSTTDRATDPTPILIAPRNEAPAGEGEAATPTPRQTAEPAAADPEAALATELTAVAEALAACLTDGQASIVATLATENYLGQLYGGGTPLPREEYLALAEGLDAVPTRIRSLRDVQREDDEQATAEVVSVVGNQLLRSRWTFVQAPRAERDEGRTAWRLDAEALLPFDPPADAIDVDVDLSDYAIELDETEIEGQAAVFRGTNAGAEDHEMLVLRFEDGATTEDLLRGSGPGLPEGISYAGQVTVPAGDEAELVLVDLEPGAYAVVCLFPTPRGTPHLALGMEAAFAVT